MKRIVVYLTDRQKAMLRGQALREGCALAALIRRMIDRAMQEAR